MASPALAIMTRVPSIQGKSRLNTLLTPLQREDLQWAFLLDTLDKVRQLAEYTCYVAATPEEQISKLFAVTGPGVEVIPQLDGNLGRRMLGIIKDLFHRGHSPLVLIGSDAPTLPPAFLLKALELLGQCQLVIGPALDGGYYLIGMNHPENRVFENIAWGSGSVLEQTTAACKHYKLSYQLLEPLRDIDRPGDLLALAEQVKKQQGLSQVSLRTAHFIKLNILRKDDHSG